MAKTRTTGPRIAPRPGTGPRFSAPQPAPPPTVVQLGGDRLLAEAREIDIDQLAPDPEQPRRHMDPARLEELAASIARHGVLQPLVVRQDGLGRDGDMRYTIVAGGRRYAAIRLLLGRPLDETTRRRVARVPVVVNDSAAAERRVLQLIENLQREDLNPVEEARALKEIMRIERLTTTGLAERVHRSQGYVDERLRLLRHEDVEEAVETGLVPKSAGAAIASLRSADERRGWIERARAGETVRARDVYASKSRRDRDRVAAGLPPVSAPQVGAPPVAPPGPLDETDGLGLGLPNFGNADPGRMQERMKQLRAATPDLTGPEAYHLAVIEARQGLATVPVAAPVVHEQAPTRLANEAPLGEPRTGDETAEGGVGAAGSPTSDRDSATLVWLHDAWERLGALPSPADDEERARLRNALLALRGAVDDALGRLSGGGPAITRGGGVVTAPGGHDVSPRRGR